MGAAATSNSSTAVMSFFMAFPPLNLTIPKEKARESTGDARAMNRDQLPGNDLLSREVTLAVPSALGGLTAVFGMGTGVSPPLEPPEKRHSNLFECRPERSEGPGGILHPDPSRCALRMTGFQRTITTSRRNEGLLRFAQDGAAFGPHRNRVRAIRSAASKEHSRIMVKPNGRLVRVSSEPLSSYTSRLLT